ncbi:hypothetical protein RPATATE_1444 [Rickettsia parkeri str. Tate's Hell]|uniref:Uncharacterized protein n=1 Tax=Rickettsia parkeri str. Tate's Hell TaxID=1359189 RepID=A0ABR5DPF1_RICPA|nr:hypothetical protein RPAAT24_1079 [Rickettsia parkeri str. AT\
MRGNCIAIDEAKSQESLLLFHEIVTQPTAARNDGFSMYPRNNAVSLLQE